MSDNFSQAYSDLTEFIADHPEIEIGDSVTSIPANVRSDFYDRFNAARNAFVEEKFPEYLARARKLQEEYSKVVAEMAPVLSFEDTPEVNNFSRFLRDPGESLTRELFDVLFDLLKNRETADSFERRASAEIRERFPGLYRGSYEKWTVLSLASLLQIENALRVPVRELQPGDRAKSSIMAPFEEVPSPEESASFFFSQSPKTIFTVPDFILHSGRLNRFVGIRSEFKEGLCHAVNASQERQWLPLDIDLLRLMAQGLTLLYADNQPSCLSLIADTTNFCRPDLVLWCVHSGSIGYSEALEIITAANEKIQPARGSFIVADDSWPEAESLDTSPVAEAQTEDASSRIQILTVGFDRSGLAPVIDALCLEKESR
jgi:hypothetical protein